MSNVNEQAKIQGGNKMNNQTNQPKISLWKCECTNCGDARSIKITQGLTPRYCSQCGSETNYQEVAENEAGENKKTPQEIHQEEFGYFVSPKGSTLLL